MFQLQSVVCDFGSEWCVAASLPKFYSEKIFLSFYTMYLEKNPRLTTPHRTNDDVERFTRRAASILHVRIDSIRDIASKMNGSTSWRTPMTSMPTSPDSTIGRCDRAVYWRSRPSVFDLFQQQRIEDQQHLSTTLNIKIKWESQFFEIAWLFYH